MEFLSLVLRDSCYLITPAYCLNLNVEWYIYLLYTDEPFEIIKSI